MIKYTLYDFFDREKTNCVLRNFSKPLKVKQRFIINDVEYKVTRIKKKVAIVRMIKYKIDNSNTSFVHKCPAKKSTMEKLDQDDLIKLEKKVGKKQVKSWTAGRVKMRGHFKQQCPFCKVIFWKESFEHPEEVSVNKIMKHKQLIKRMIPR